MLRRLWNDDAGFIISAELVLVATILVIGMIVGLVAVRNAVVQELVDVAQAIGNVSQSYCFGGIYKNCMAMTDGSCYHDVVDFCQQNEAQPNWGTPGGITITCPAGIVAPTSQERGTAINP